MNRSFLFVPAHKEKLILKAIQSNADTLIFDFEDSVPDLQSKSSARKLFQSYAEAAAERHEVWVRVNESESNYFKDDLECIADVQPSAILYPKIDTRDKFELGLLKQYGLGIISQGMALVECPRGVTNIADICQSNFISGVVFGNEDYEAELFCLRKQRPIEMLTPRSLIALHAKANNILAIDSVTINYDDKELLSEQINSGVRLGFNGKLCLSPKEIDLVNTAYQPTAKEFENAKRIIMQFEKQAANGSGVSKIDGVFTGPPMVKWAKQILNKYKL